MRIEKTVLCLIALVLLGLGGWRLTRYLASQHQQFQDREFVQAHPLLLWLGPNQQAAQDGYTLVAIQDAGQPFQYQETTGGASYQYGSNASLRGNTAFWLKVDVPTSSTAFASSRLPDSAHVFSVTARSSTGDTFLLTWEFNSSQPGPFLHAILPAGYPDTYHWVDVTVDDHHGHQAMWRISHLPPMLHLIAPPVQTRTTYRQGGAVLTARAWRQRDPYNAPHPPIVMYSIRGSMSPYQHQWEVVYLGNQWEWGATNTPPSHFIMSEGFTATGQFNDGGQPVAYDDSVPPLPYLNSTRYVRLFCQLRQFETHVETVTFRSVPLRRNKSGTLFLAPPHPLSLKTPSGITVTLSDASAADPDGANNFGRDAIGYMLGSDPRSVIASLPASPLWRKYRKPLTITVDASPPKGYQTAGSETSSQGRNKYSTIYFLRGPRPSPSVFAALEVSVQQRVDLRTIPMTFTVPIGRHP